MSAYRDSLLPEQVPVYDQAVAEAARIYAEATAHQATLTAREAAIEAYVPGGRSVDELEDMIRRLRERARSEAAA